MNCWLCGAVADSREHKFKGADLRRHYGKRGSAFFISEASPKPIQNYKDELLTFDPVLCRRCNNERTQAYDLAYDAYVKYIESNYAEVRAQATIDFSRVFGEEWQTQRLNLLRYFAKHAGCKIMTGAFPTVPQDLIDFVNGSNSVESLFIHFELKEGIYYFEQKSKEIGPYGHLFNGPTLYFKAGLEDSRIMSHAGWLSYSWMCVNWVVSPRLSKDRRLKEVMASHPVEITTLEGCPPFTPDMSPFVAIENIEYGAYRATEERVARIKQLIGSE